MRTPTLLDQLSQAAREDQEAMNRLDERWDRLAAGELSEAEHDELRGLADATGEGYEAYQAFKPLGTVFQRNVAAAILAQREREEDEKAEAAAAAAAALAASKKMDSPVPPQLPERKGIFKWAGALAAATSLAAGLLFFIPPGLGDGSIFLNLKSSPPRLGTRGIETEPGQAAESEIGPYLLRIGSYFDLSLRMEGIEGDLDQRLYLYREGRLAELPLDQKNGDRIDIPSHLSLKPGPAKLVLVYFRPKHEPDLEEIVAELARPDEKSSRFWRLALADVVLEDL